MNRSIFFIIEGSVRYFDYNEENADERVIAVLDSGNFVVETTSFLQKKPAMLNNGCCQSSRLLVMKAHNLDRLLSSSYYDTFQEVVARVLALYFEYLQKVVTMLKLNVSEKLSFLASFYPSLLQIPQNQLAKFLSIKPETLEQD